MGLMELLLIVLVIAAIAGGIGVSPLLWLLLVVALVRLPHGRRIRLSQRRAGLAMTLGTSIFLIAVGAIIRYGVTFHVSGVSRPTIG